MWLPWGGKKKWCSFLPCSLEYSPLKPSEVMYAVQLPLRLPGCEEAQISPRVETTLRGSETIWREKDAWPPSCSVPFLSFTIPTVYLLQPLWLQPLERSWEKTTPSKASRISDPQKSWAINEMITVLRY